MVCGHIHEQYGVHVVRHPSYGFTTTIMNVSHNTENYEPINRPMEIVEFSYLEQENAA
jgi:hypothetical protein